MNYFKRVAMTFAGLILLAPFGVAQQATPQTTPPQKRPMNIEARQRRQQRRIAQGVGNGQLTAKETAQIERREAGIEKREQKMRASGGKFTKGERKAVQKQLNSTSRQIYRDKHNAKKQ